MSIDTVKVKDPKLRKRKVSELSKASTNVRYEYPDEAMATLRTSIREIGLLELPKCTPKGEVFAGWGRVQAAKEEDIEEILVLEVDYLNETDQILASLSENFARADLYDDELRFALKRLVDEKGLSVPEIAQKTGMATPQVYSLLSFYKLPQLAQEIAKEEPKTGIYQTTKIRQIVSEVPEEEQEDVAVKLMETTKLMPKGRQTKKEHGHETRSVPTLEEIAEVAKTGRSMKSELERILDEAKKREYMTITVSMPDDVYLPFFKAAKIQGMTIHELIIKACREHLPEVQKTLQGQEI